MCILSINLEVYLDQTQIFIESVGYKIKIKKHFTVLLRLTATLVQLLVVIILWC